jgi:hypothetical protein
VNIITALSILTQRLPIERPGVAVVLSSDRTSCVLASVTAVPIMISAFAECISGGAFHFDCSVSNSNLFPSAPDSMGHTTL